MVEPAVEHEPEAGETGVGDEQVGAAADDQERRQLAVERVGQRRERRRVTRPATRTATGPPTW